MSLTRINPPELFDPTPYGYVHVITGLSGDFVVVAGQGWVLTTAEGTFLDTDFATQVQGAFASVRLALQVVNLDFADVIQATSYVVGPDASRGRIIRETALQTWAEKPPAHTVVGVAGLAAPEALFEIEAIAARR